MKVAEGFASFTSVLAGPTKVDEAKSAPEHDTGVGTTTGTRNDLVAREVGVKTIMDIDFINVGGFREAVRKVRCKGLRALLLLDDHRCGSFREFGVKTIMDTDFIDDGGFREAVRKVRCKGLRALLLLDDRKCGSFRERSVS